MLHIIVFKSAAWLVFVSYLVPYIFCFQYLSRRFFKPIKMDSVKLKAGDANFRHSDGWQRAWPVEKANIRGFLTRRATNSTDSPSTGLQHPQSPLTGAKLWPWNQDHQNYTVWLSRTQWVVDNNNERCCFGGGENSDQHCLRLLSKNEIAQIWCVNYSLM